MDKRDEGLAAAQRDRLIEEKIRRLKDKRRALSETLKEMNLRLEEAKSRRDDAMMYAHALDEEIERLAQGQLPLMDEDTDGH